MVKEKNLKEGEEEKQEEEEDGVVDLEAQTGVAVEQPVVENGSNVQKSDGESTYASTDPNTGLTTAQVEASRETWGLNEIPVPNTPLYMIFLRQFSGFLQILIEIAAIITLALRDWTDFAIITALLLVNALLGFREEYHAKQALDKLSDSLESEVAVRRNGEIENVPTSQLVPGDVLLLVGGTVVPADTKWIKGDTMSIDTAPLTGEPIPRKYPSSDHGDIILSGTTVVAGECYGVVVNTGSNTEIGKAQADVLQDKSVRIVSVFEKKIMRVVQVTVVISLLISIAVLLVKGIAYDGFDSSVENTILAALSIMIASIPVALPLVVKVNLALGASFLAEKHHAIVTTIPALQDIASMSMLCSDKTGTLTTAKMSIIMNRIIANEGFTETDVIRFAYLCSNPDKKDDPIDAAVVRAYQESEVAEEETDYKQTGIIGFSPQWKRVISFVQHEGKTITIAKGLPAKIIDTEAGGIDDHELQWKVENYDKKEFVELIQQANIDLSKAGYKTIAIAMCEGDGREQDQHGPWKFVGLMPMLDPPRQDTKATIESLHHANISVKMITGDHVNVAKETARLIGLGSNIHAGEDIRAEPSQQRKNEMIWAADGFAAVLPSDKREVVMTLKNEFGTVCGMTGDGVNDAPALSAAQVGIAVEGATDAARNAADLILTEPGLSPIYGAVLESRRIFARLKAYVVYRIAASMIIVLTLSIVIFATGCAVTSLLIIILALVNDISMIPVAYDNAAATTKPAIPRTSKLLLQSLYYGILQTALGLMFIFIMSYSAHDFELTRSCNNAAQSFIWMHLVLVTELAIFSVRAPSFFFLSMPSPILLVSVLGTCVVCSIIAVYGKDLPGSDLGWIWLFNIGTFIVADIGKVWFRNVIDDAPGDIIESDELVEYDDTKTEVLRYKEKQERYLVHEQSQMDPAEMQHNVEIRHSTRMLQPLLDDPAFTDGFLQARRRQRTVSTLSGMNDPAINAPPPPRRKSNVW